MNKTFKQQIQEDIQKYGIFGHQPMSGSSINPMANQHSFLEFDYTTVPLWFFSNTLINPYQPSAFHELNEILMIDIAVRLAQSKIQIRSVQIFNLWEDQSFENLISQKSIDQTHQVFAMAQRKNELVFRLELNNHILYVINAESLLFQQWLMNTIEDLKITYDWVLYLGAMGQSYMSTVDIHEFIIPKLIFENQNLPCMIIEDYQFIRTHQPQIQLKYISSEIKEIRSQRILNILQKDNLDAFGANLIINQLFH